MQMDTIMNTIVIHTEPELPLNETKKGNTRNG